MKDYRSAAQSFVRFLHKLEPGTKRLTTNSKLSRFFQYGILPPDVHAALSFVEMEYSVGMTDEVDVSELYDMTPLVFFRAGMKEKKLTKRTNFDKGTLVAVIYREFIKEGIADGGPN